MRLDPDVAAVAPEPYSMRLKQESPSLQFEPAASAVEPPRMTYAPPMFASAAEPPRRRSRGLRLWFAAAASLVIGILIGFASGFRAAQNAADAPAATEGPAPTSGSASPGQPFTESSVSEPVRVDPKEVAPNPAPVDPDPTPPAPVRSRTGSAPRPAHTPAPAAAEAPRVATGPGSLEVVSRPAGAEVIVDGTSVGRTPISVEVSPGAHTIRLALPGFNPWQTTVDVRSGSPTRVSGSLEQ
jgi:hypothetical protein